MTDITPTVAKPPKHCTACGAPIGAHFSWCPTLVMSSGMTLRDYFAAKAMHALYTTIYEYEFTGSPRAPEFKALMEELAVDAYGLADAMLKAREKK
jgi:hypothetical protein